MIETLARFRTVLQQAAEDEAADGRDSGTSWVVVTSGGLAGMLTLVAAVRDAGPWPRLDFDGPLGLMSCADCHHEWVEAVYSAKRVEVPHDDDCPGVRIAAAMAELQGAADG